MERRTNTLSKPLVFLVFSLQKYWVFTFHFYYGGATRAQCGGEIYSREKAIKFHGFRKTVSRFLEEKIPADVPAEKVVLFFSADGTVPVEKTGDRTHSKYFFPMDGGVPVEKREIERALSTTICP